MASVSLAMIAKNEAANIEAAIGPLRASVNDIVVVDTGSSDATRTIAAELGARIFEFPWQDSFSAARNHAIDRATGDWVLIVDADDRFAAYAVERLNELVRALQTENVGYAFTTVSIAADGGMGAAVEQVRLFPRRADLRYRYRVHEQIVPAIEAGGGSVRATGIKLHHVGYSTSEILDRKIDRNLRLVEIDCDENPGDAFPLLNRGIMLVELGRAAEAIVCLTLASSGIGSRGMLGRSLSMALARAHKMDGDVAQAIAVARSGRNSHPGDALLASVEAEMLVETGDLPGAAACLADLPFRPDLPTADVRARALFAEVLLSMGRYPEAIDVARNLVESRPGLGRAWFVLADALFAQGRHEDVRVVAERVAMVPGASQAAGAILDLAGDSGGRVPRLSCSTPPWRATSLNR